jgi:hypothetical protein
MTGAIQSWKVGDLFRIPLKDGSFLLGQIVAIEPSVLNSVSCALFDMKLSCDMPQPKQPHIERLFAILFTTRDLLDSGAWKVFGNAKVEVTRSQLPYEALRSSGFIGAKIVGSRNVEEFANAYCGLTPWDDWADPEYLDRLLLSPNKKPKTLVYKRDNP